MLRFASLRVAPPSHLHLRLSPIPNHTNQRLSIVVSPFLPLSTSSRTSKTRVTLTTPFAPWTAATSWADAFVLSSLVVAAAVTVAAVAVTTTVVATAAAVATVSTVVATRPSALTTVCV